MEVDKDSWQKLRVKKKFDLKHLYAGLSLNPTFNMTIQKLQFNLNILQKIPFGNPVQKLFQESKMRLDKQFNITTLHNADG